MEVNAQYALYDNEATPPAWAARVRLTPEVLNKLRQAPEQVILQLNSEGRVKSHNSNKKTSLMTVKLAETEERYELLSFPEDPGINHVCAFRWSAGDGSTCGYSIHKMGAIHQKLLVQRLLDDTEKDRIKDKHAKSVLASKSRSSKMISSKLESPAKKQKPVTRLSSVSNSKTSSCSSARSIPVGLKRSIRLALPSALTKEEGRRANERIERGLKVDMEVPMLAAVNRQSSHNTQEQEKVKPFTEIGCKEMAAATCNAEFHALFSSDSDDEDIRDRRSRVLQKQKTKAIAEVQSVKSVWASKEIGLSEIKSVARAANSEGSETILDVTQCTASKSGAIVNVAQSAKSDERMTQGKRSGEAMGAYLSKSMKSSSGVEVKRARVRSALISDRVKQSQLPDLSYFPSAVVEICQQIGHYHGRSVILDDDDYDFFVKTYEHLQRDWEMLDKAYSIEMIKSEGLHLQLEAATKDMDHEELKTRIQASFSKKEGLLFVRDAMTSIQKILLSIQTSIDRFNLKSYASQR